MAAAAIIGAAVTIGESLFGSHKTDAQKATEFTQSVLQQMAAGDNAGGHGLSGLQYRAAPTYPWMLQPDTRPIMLAAVGTAVRQGYAKASDFDPSVAAAAGLTGNEPSAPAQKVSPTGTGTTVTTVAQLTQPKGGLPLWVWLAGLGVGGFFVVRHFMRRRK